MRRILSLPNGGECADPRTLAEFAHIAEQSGWEAVLLEDYLVYQNKRGTPTYDPWVSLAAMAMRTERVRLGTAVTPLPRRRVAKVAAECVALDHLSNGRLILGVGAGDPWDASLTAFGDARPDRERAALLDEQLAVLVGLWSGEPFRFAGQFVHIDEVALLPRPVQQPRIPIWVGGSYPRRGPVERALRWDGSIMWKPMKNAPDAQIMADWTPDEIRSLRGLAGRQDFAIVVGGRERKPDSAAERELIASLSEAGATAWQEWLAPADRQTMQAAIARGPL